MNPTTWTLLITGISTGTIITLTSNHWLLAWLGLELNTLSILPMIIKPHHPRATEAAVKYFIIQTTAAALILLSGISTAWTTGQWTTHQPMDPLPATLLTVAIMLKLGLAPAHAWYPEVVQGSTMPIALVISTWQKLAPLSFLYMMAPQLPTTTLLMIGVLSALTGGLMGLNQTQTRKIMAFSSIAHMGWLMAATTIGPNLMTLTLLTYIIMTTAMFIALNTTTTKTLLDLSTMWSNTPTLQLTTLANLLSLGGLPPMTGFLPKLLILKTLTTKTLTPLGTTLIMSSLPSLFFYVRMTYIASLTTPSHTTSTKHNWRFKTSAPHTLALMTMLATLTLPMTPLVYQSP
uniref:NADH-ubiquinone oxidoreductase chain 2 n=1 Tax=Homonota fasciata TaxID=401549 RepID=A0A1Y1CC59_9SAUR|nr:NADH dehydrogenase subunit 2 [Homonota fasciata]